jgi:hypothetical protein
MKQTANRLPKGVGVQVQKQLDGAIQVASQSLQTTPIRAGF